MDSMHKHLANKCPLRLPIKKAKVSYLQHWSVMRDFEIVIDDTRARTKTTTMTLTRSQSG
jgi:hypothetical protein